MSIIIIIITDDGGWRRLHRGDRLRSESPGRQKCALVDIFFSFTDFGYSSRCYIIIIMRCSVVRPSSDDDTRAIICIAVGCNYIIIS